MRASAGRVLVVAAACLVWLTGCETSTKLTDLFGTQRDDPRRPPPIRRPGRPPADPDDHAGSVAVPAVSPTPVRSSMPPIRGLLGNDPYDDLSLGKKYFRAANFGLAEKHFRRAVELHPRDAEAWVGLAASYDRLKRFDLADRAYGQAVNIIGETPELMNNRGFSYMLRGDYVRARRTLEAAQAKDAGQSLHPEQSRAAGKSPAPRQGDQLAASGIVRERRHLARSVRSAAAVPICSKRPFAASRDRRMMTAERSVMLQAFKQFLSDLAGGDKDPSRFEDNDYRLAAAALLVHAAMIDGDMSDVERDQAASRVIMQRFDLDEAAAA